MYTCADSREQPTYQAAPALSKSARQARCRLVLLQSLAAQYALEYSVESTVDTVTQHTGHGFVRSVPVREAGKSGMAGVVIARKSAWR